MPVPEAPRARRAMQARLESPYILYEGKPEYPEDNVSPATGQDPEFAG
jgi:hypothetical protein